MNKWLDSVQQSMTRGAGGGLNSGNQKEEEEKEKSEGEGLALSSQETAMTPQGQQQPQAQSQQGSAAGAKFRNLKSYIDKSKSNMAGQIGAGLQRQESKVGQQLGQAGQQFKETKESEEARLKTGQEGYGSVEQATKTIGEQATDLDAGSKLPAGTETEEQKTQRQNYENFAGWQRGDLKDLSVRGQQDIQSGLQSLGEKAQNLATEGGRFQQLQETLGRGRQYSQGAQKLDQLLLQTQTPQLQQLQELRKNVGKQTGEEFKGLVGASQAAQSELGLQAKKLAGNIGEGITGVETATQEEINRRLKEIEESQAYRTIRGQTPLNEQELGEMVSRNLGVSGDAAKNLYGANTTELDNLMTQLGVKYGQLTASDVAKQQELDKLNVLSRLSNKDQMFLSEAKGLTGEDITKDYSGALGKFQESVGDRQKVYTEKLSNVQNLLKSMQDLAAGGRGWSQDWRDTLSGHSQNLVSQYENLSNQYNQALMDLSAYGQDIEPINKFDSSKIKLDPSVERLKNTREHGLYTMALGRERDRLENLHNIEVMKKLQELSKSNIPIIPKRSIPSNK